MKKNDLIFETKILKEDLMLTIIYSNIKNTRIKRILQNVRF